MEARQTLRGSAVPKAILVVLAVCAAVLLAFGASFISKDLTGSGSTVTRVHPARGTVLRQDYQGPTTAAHAAPGTVLRQDYQGPASQPLIDRGAERGGQSTGPIAHMSVEDMPGFRD